MKTIITAVVTSLVLALGSHTVRSATIVWTNTAGGNWNATANWSPNQVPVAADNAVITNSGTYTVTLNVSASVASLTLGGATGTQTFQQSGNTLTLNGASSFGTNGTYNFVGGTLGGAGSFTINGPFNWSSGTINNTVVLTLNGTSTLSGVVSGGMLLGGQLINGGTLTWIGSGNNLSLANGTGTLTNLATGTIFIATDIGVTTFAGGGTIGNAGVLRKIGGSGTTTFPGGITLINSGDVQVQSGTLTVAGGGLASGTFEVSANATLQFAANYTLSSASSITGAGNVLFSGGTINENGTYNLTGTNTISGAVVNFNAGATVSLGKLTLSSGTLGGTLALSISGPFNWSSGTINNTVVVTLNGPSTLSGVGSGVMLLGGQLINGGTLTWSGSGNNLSLANGTGTLTNLATGTITITADIGVLNFAGGGTVGNAGLLRKTGGSGTTTFPSGITLINSGDVQVQSGTLTVAGGGSASGTLEVSANATLQFSANYTLSAGSSVTGAGLVLESAGTVTGNGNITLSGTNTIGGGTLTVSSPGTMAVTNLIFSSGTLNGNGPVTVNGSFTWTGGTIGSVGGVTLNGTSSMSSVVAAGMAVNGGLLKNAGTLTWSGSGANLNIPSGGAFTNLAGGTVNITTDVSAQDTSGFSTIGNAGTLRKTGGTGTTSIAFGIAFVNTGTVVVENGTINCAGSYNLNGGTLDFGINSLASFGKINLSGAAALAGTVGAHFNGGYSPIGGNAFAVLTYGSRTGIFTNTALPSGMAWQTNYAATTFTLTVLNVTPTLVAPATQSVNELTTLTATNTATDPDIPSQTLSFDLVSKPVGMTINSGTGIITWTPAQTQSPSTNTVLVSVTDNGTPPLSATNSFTVIVKEVNVAPVLPVLGPTNINELTQLTVTNTATESNIHSIISGYGLINPPTGMSITTSGIITWTPSQLQSPATNTIITIVTNANPYDLVNPQLTSTNSFTVIVKEVNVAPTFVPPADQVVNELTLLTVTNAATEFNIHSTTIGYGLVNPPAGMTITTDGIITWTPSQLQSPATNTIVTVVTNSNAYDLVNPQLTSTNRFTVIVKEVNVVPVLPLLSQTNINALVLLTVTNTATQSNIHSILGYALISPPVGASISASGIITWTPSQSQGPSTNTITTVVTNSNPYDLMAPNLTATNSFTVVVFMPTLAPLGNFTVNVGQTVSFSASAADNDPTRTLAFSLGTAPAGATINPASGLFNWRPPVASAGSSNSIQVRVTDNSEPPLSATQSFYVLVNALTPVTLTPLSKTSTEFQMQVTGPIGPDYVLQASESLSSVAWIKLLTNTPVASPFTATDTNTSAFTNRYYRVILAP